jgi:hypothetical protein
MENLETKTLSQIARLIQQDWKKVNYAAAPYLDAMRQLQSVDDAYMYDSGRSIVRYFLGNAGTWRGDVAKAIKAELKRRTA